MTLGEVAGDLDEGQKVRDDARKDLVGRLDILSAIDRDKAMRKLRGRPAWCGRYGG